METRSTMLISVIADGLMNDGRSEHNFLFKSHRLTMEL
jgi:hypothetical protein